VNLRPKRREDPELNVTPLIDVVFLLLIFFMVSTTFRHEGEIKVDLPEASGEEAADTQIMEVVINREGRYFIGGQQVVGDDMAALKRALGKAMEGYDRSSLVIRADASTPHQAVVTAMDAAGQLGLVNISIATVQKE
jgi:biopolymer transport protein ExbD